MSSCMGSFKLIRGVYSWNESVTDSKVANNILFWAMFAIPVYQAVGILDLVLFNLIEFWTGSNPISMNDGEFEQKRVNVKGQDYILTASKNNFQIESCATGEAINLLYTAENKTWNLLKDGTTQPLAKQLEENRVELYLTTGGTQVYEMNQNNFALLGEQLDFFDALAAK